MINIFLSRPTWVPKQFTEGLTGFLELLAAMELRPRTLGATDYPAKAPLDEVIKLMGECRGAIILGYPQIEINAGTEKGAATDRLLLATEWNHIEAALAYAAGLPLLVIHHQGVRRGIFDHGTLNCFVYQKDLSSPGWPVATELRGALTTWKSAMLAAPQVEPAEQTVVGLSNTPTCPNCSSTTKRFFMRPVPKDFVAIVQASHECSQCGFKTLASVA